jgi:hypothetical protein
VIAAPLTDEVRVTVIATGFGPLRRRRRREESLVAPEPRTREREGFEVSDDVLDVPSFLRDDR